MRPIFVTDYMLKHGIDDVTQWLPNPSLPIEYWAESVAQDIFYGNFKGTLVSRTSDLNQIVAMRHLKAIGASKKLSPIVKIQNIARLLTIWYSGAING